MVNREASKLLIVKNVTREGPGLIEIILREKGILFDVADLDRGDPFPSPIRYRALIVLGGPESANDSSPKITHELKRVRECIEDGIPFLGICLGMQILAKAAGGKVGPCAFKEIGFYDADGFRFEVFLTDEGKKDPLFREFPESFLVFQLHGETVLPGESLVLLGQGRKRSVQIIRAGRSAWGIQFHSELTLPLLETWAAEDRDLNRIDAEDLLRHYRAIQEQYERTGRRLFGNFLTQAGFSD